ncbi:hypothetical protein SAMN02745126_06339 [Enhydrobacter aerosaccus]|uniref:Uncharacterized protein n=1 Tax=Enhydrobacter aerosaccus TaxID=225324 RepID=A0A1T4TIW3_9HYPH|nr:hypothetical protein [Enhydrobacter aerosaccus]SKA40367.1 hypothetical protein SAMN02745126_06339 [Enhydrobacter aerosaccus]
MTHDNNDHNDLEPVHDAGVMPMPHVEEKARTEIDGAVLAIVRASRQIAEAAEMVVEDAKRSLKAAHDLREAHAAQTAAPALPPPAPPPQPAVAAQASVRPQAALSAPRRVQAPVEPAFPAASAVSVIGRASAIPPWAVAAGIGFVALLGLGAFAVDRFTSSRSQDVLMSAPPPAAAAPLRLPSQDQIPDRYLPQERR